MLRGEVLKQDAIQNWITKTNQYAKRQGTWFRGQYVADLEIKNVPNADDLERVIQTLK